MKIKRKKIKKEKKDWNSPQLFSLDIKKTQSGSPYVGTEDGLYAPLES
ncbi:MAG: hypothetical protein JW973_01000 [Bacteroidales bacterium]|nr:hypothetical protein [Bacteroidales bacterium]